VAARPATGCRVLDYPSRNATRARKRARVRATPRLAAWRPKQYIRLTLRSVSEGVTPPRDSGIVRQSDPSTGVLIPWEEVHSLPFLSCRRESLGMGEDH